MPDFATRFRVIAPERRGHGHTPDLEGPLSYDVMSSDMIGFLTALVGGPAYLVGWSDGGVVGLRSRWPVRTWSQARRDRHELRRLGPDAEAMEGLRSLRPTATT